MKKFLLASTAVVAFAGAAAAEVAISGSGRMGLVYDGEDTVFSSRVRIAFALTSETDSGLTFGASIRADNASEGNRGRAGSVFASGAFGKLSMGDVDGAAESAVGNLSGVGYTGVGDYNEQFYLQQGNSDIDSNDQLSAFALPAALYEYTSGGFSGYIGIGNPAGIELSNDNFGNNINDTFFDSPTYDVEAITLDQSVGLGAKFAQDNYSVGIGYERLDFTALLNNGTTTTVTNPLTGVVTNVFVPNGTQTEFKSDLDHVILGGSVEFSGFTLKANYGEASGDLLDLTQYGISGDYAWDAFTVTAFYNHKELEDKNDTQSVTQEPFGLGIKYDLGGGASFAAGVVDPDIQGIDYQADVGVNFSF